MFKPSYKIIKLAVACSALFIVTACVQTGYSYDTTRFGSIKAGESTLDDVNKILGAQPANIYRALDGSFTAMYYHKTSVLADAIYSNNQLLLAFDNEGKYKHVVGGAGQNLNNEKATTQTNILGSDNTAEQPLQASSIEEQVEVIEIETDGQPTATITETINTTDVMNTECPAECSASAPNTYPVYLKRAGNKVVKRYDIKQ